jgi:hypothetical protein
VALRITLHSRCRHAAAFGTWIALAWAPAFAQVSANQETSPATRDKVNEITVDGCLYGAQGNLELVNGDDAFSLRGDTSTLKKYLGDEVMVRGKQEGSRPPLSLVVSGVTLIFKAPQVKLGKAIADPTNWHFQTNESYGVKFAAWVQCLALHRATIHVREDEEHLPSTYEKECRTLTIKFLEPRQREDCPSTLP